MLRLRYINKHIKLWIKNYYTAFWNANWSHNTSSLYFTGNIKKVKRKNKTIIEISKNIDDSSKLDELLSIFDERKKEPIDYRRNGVITIFVGIGLYLLGYYAIGNILKGVGALVGLIGIGTMIAGYLYPNTGKELTDAVEKYEKE